MSAPSTAPLAALFASHPEECAAVAIVFAIMDYQSGGIDVGYARDEVRRFNPAMPLDRVREILAAMVENGVLLLNPWGEHRMCRDGRAAIARVGAAAWLRARLGPPASTNPLNLGAIRLCALASEGARIGAIHRAAFAIGATFPRNAEEYRARLLDVEWASEGLPVAPLDVEAEVAAVWGPMGAERTEEQR